MKINDRYYFNRFEVKYFTKSVRKVVCCLFLKVFRLFNWKKYNQFSDSLRTEEPPALRFEVELLLLAFKSHLYEELLLF